MHFGFFKYQGAGNDFIIIDNRSGKFTPDVAIIREMCDRHFGIGADGLILIHPDDDAEFRMVYFNSDGRESTMCGNGGRCIAWHSYRMGICGEALRFMAADGIHHARILRKNDLEAIVSLSMADVHSVVFIPEGYCINTGSPHLVQFRTGVAGMDVAGEGSRLRWDQRFGPEGTNVNFAEESENAIHVRTFERGVEDETLSCGTGVTATALAAIYKNAGSQGSAEAAEVEIHTPGGNLKVSAIHTGQSFTGIHLEGPARFVFRGEITI